MTEIPEHLLRRSRERRGALGLGGSGDAGGGDEGGGAAPVPARSEGAPAPAVATAAAVPAVEAPPAIPERPDPPYVAAAKRRTRIPFWALPVVAFLPLWGFLYAQVFLGPQKVAAGPLAEGAALFASNCSSCHGSNGEGGVGPQLNNGQVLLTFSKFADQVKFVTNGSGNIVGQGYGDANRPGGQHIAKLGSMPAWGTQLTAEQISAVVCHERVVFGNENPVPTQCTQAGAAAAAAGSTSK